MNIDRDRLVKALRQFGACDEKDIPTNAATLWRQLVAGVSRVAKSLSEE
jgi:hypothetical protein